MHAESLKCRQPWRHRGVGVQREGGAASACGHATRAGPRSRQPWLLIFVCSTCGHGGRDRGLGGVRMHGLATNPRVQAPWLQGWVGVRREGRGPPQEPSSSARPAGVEAGVGVYREQSALSKEQKVQRRRSGVPGGSSGAAAAGRAAAWAGRTPTPRTRAGPTSACGTHKAVRTGGTRSRTRRAQAGRRGGAGPDPAWAPPPTPPPTAPQPPPNRHPNRPHLNSSITRLSSNVAVTYSLARS